MRGPDTPRAALDADLERLEREQLLEIQLDDIRDLVCEPDADPFAVRTGPPRSGLDDLALTLGAVVRLPEVLTVRVVLPAGVSPDVPMDDAAAAMRRAARDSATVAWREAMAVRAMGRSQFPLGMTIAILAAVVAYGAGYLAGSSDPLGVRVLLLVVAAMAITVAWMVSWMVLEAATLDWRQSGRRAMAYDLLARATLEVAAPQQ